MAELYARYWGAARAAAEGVTHDFATAEDVAAEAFQVAFARLPQLRDPERFGSWLRRIVVRLARRRPPLQPARPKASAVPEPGAVLEQRELATRVREAVARLPGAEREAVLLYYFEGYDTDQAARFLGIPPSSLRRRLHDGRERLRARLLPLLEGTPVMEPTHPELAERVRALLSGPAAAAEAHAVLREVLQTRPVPHHLLATLGQGLASQGPAPGSAAALLARPGGPIMADPGPVGETARLLRDGLAGCTEWPVDLGGSLGPADLYVAASDGPGCRVNPQLVPPCFATGQAGCHYRCTRGLLFPGAEGTVVDAAQLLQRTGTLAGMSDRAGQAWISDVLDLYWSETRPGELAEVQARLADLAGRVASGAAVHFTPHDGPRYRMALRLALGTDPRPAALGGVLAAWPGMPEDLGAVHVRLYLEPWTQARTGQPVALARPG